MTIKRESGHYHRSVPPQIFADDRDTGRKKKKIRKCVLSSARNKSSASALRCQGVPLRFSFSTLVLLNLFSDVLQKHDFAEYETTTVMESSSETSPLPAAYT